VDSGPQGLSSVEKNPRKGTLSERMKKKQNGRNRRTQTKTAGGGLKEELRLWRLFNGIIMYQG